MQPLWRSVVDGSADQTDLLYTNKSAFPSFNLITQTYSRLKIFKMYGVYNKIFMRTNLTSESAQNESNRENARHGTSFLYSDIKNYISPFIIYVIKYTFLTNRKNFLCMKSKMIYLCKRQA